ncbi:MAG: hypothetical protein JSS20_18970, partial [Proteobacteria bacterium]|nr:hypothetical protein [Pseudomonadota bacterium]
ASSMKDDLRYTPTDCFATFPFPRNFEDNSKLEVTGRDYYAQRTRYMASQNEGLTKTYNRFHKPSEKALDILKLRELHAAMDAAVLEAYGWNDLAQSATAEFIELPTDPGKKAKYRLSWPSDVQDEVLKRLLALNAERSEAERRAGVTPSVAASDLETVSDQEGDDEDEPEDDGDDE